MSYTALYRRYRSQTFAELVGQEHISRVLGASVRRGTFVHAYLFCGPRGTGKTSAARIMARAINCQQPTAGGDPCGCCPSCRRDLSGEGMDVIEIDGASNRGIDEIRDLRERVKYAPAQEKYKIYIIDEVHMLTNDAFNALLKTLEEPPGHVVFIMATTAPHKIPLTVLSRCQRFDFHRISDADISRHLLDIAAREGIPLDADAAALIARKSEGGMRDAISLLDQCAGILSIDPSARVDRHAVSELLGSMDRDFILNWLELLLSHQTAAALAQVEELVNAGRDLRQAGEDLLSAARDLLLDQLNRRSGRPSAAEDVPDWAGNFAPAAYLALLQSLSDVDQRLRNALSPRIALELALIRAVGLPDGNTAAPAVPKAAPAATKAAPAVPKTAPAATKAASAAPKTAPAAETGEAPAIEMELIRDKWPEVLERVEAKNAGAAAILRDALPARIEGHRLLLDFPPDDAGMLSIITAADGFRTLIETALALSLRTNVSIDAFIGQPRAEESAPAAPVLLAEPEQDSMF